MTSCLRARGLVLLGVLAGCSRHVADSAAVPKWPTDPKPFLMIGANSTDPGQDLAGITSARLVDGHLIVANSGSLELRVFDSAGGFERAEGRKGQGPGEFTNRVYLFAAPGDSLYTLDEGSLRWSLHTPKGRFVRVIQGGADALPRPTWLYHRTIVENPGPDAIPAWALDVIDHFPEAAAGVPVRRARFDDLGYLWVDSSATGHWLVFGDSGTPVALVELSKGFDLRQAGKDFVLGIEHDSVDQELVTAYRIRRDHDLPPSSALPSQRLPSADSTLQAHLITDLVQLTVAQELFYSNHGSYTARADSLDAKPKSGAELALIAGDKRHWIGILYDRATKTTCGLSVGSPAPPGWIDGRPFCGR